MAEGFTNYLTKPIDSKALEKMLVKYLPADKVLIGRKKEPEISKTDLGLITGPDLFAPLREAGIDPSLGLGYCGNEEEFYMSLLKEYAQGAEEKQRNMRKYFEAEDWKDYAILVHALKSTSKMIGAAELSDEAAELESAANAQNAGIIRSRHAQVLESYTATAAAIRAVLPDTGDPAEEGEEDILEFYPDA